MLETAIEVQTGEAPAKVRPRLGFAGLGWIGRNRLEALAASGAGEIAAVCEPCEDARKQATAVVPGVAAVARFEELLSPEIDGVVIATPNACHASQAIAALEAGKAVFCQKPLGRDATETRRVIDAARAANRLLQVDLSYRFTAAMECIRALIQSGALGRIYAIEGVFHNAYGPAKPWFYERVQAGGGCLLDLGIHLIDLALWSLDFPTITAARGQIIHRNAPLRGTASGVEDYASALLQFDDCISVQLACSWHAPAGCDARIALTFFGSEGGAAFTNVNGSFYDFRAEHFLPDRSRRTIISPPDAWGGRAALAWCRQLARAPHFDSSVENLNHVAEAIDRIYRGEL